MGSGTSACSLPRWRLLLPDQVFVSLDVCLSVCPAASSWTTSAGSRPRFLQSSRIWSSPSPTAGSRCPSAKSQVLALCSRRKHRSCFTPHVLPGGVFSSFLFAGPDEKKPAEFLLVNGQKYAVVGSVSGSKHLSPSLSRALSLSL